MRRSGSGDPELQSLANRDNLVNPAPAWHGEGQVFPPPYDAWKPSSLQKKLAINHTPCYYSVNLNDIDRSNQNYV